MHKPIRRIVTGHDAKGVAVVVEDRDAPNVRTVELRGGLTMSELWVSDRSPMAIDAPDATASVKTLQPPAGGNVFRVVRFPPEKTFIHNLTGEKARAAFGAVGSAEASQHSENVRHPLMHKTKTVDYGLVLEGEIWLVLDDSEVLCRQGDVIIQRGTNHAWSNRSDNDCAVAFILIDGEHDK
ncbi:MAG: cupin domain-containing protein [Rhodocyclaceae bacterium]|nr:cupin domain-containing protein [Rhodocyclaceae bacterium]MCA3073812.1 cupin domain-containing protein [Rhodocyclaceae bacterium]MCA3091795.1 cupin domain-containing protein [Rhodocyclaceae bacterium]MCA3093311.1 cupin domain-containing protein [Rhodocyclaceae bacterium]MCA3100102.1 cupin domain-containing protein [Rhodocyclaceae bacterium]